MALNKIDIVKEHRGIGPVDLLVIVLLVGFLAGLMAVGQQWRSPYQASADINLSLGSLVYYCLLSLARNFAAYVLSLGLAFWWGMWAAKSRAAEKILVPVVDILQSIPVLGFMPGLVLGLVHVFPNSRVGLELACILMILTSQAWNMILSVYQSVKGIPQSMNDLVSTSRFSRRQRFLNLELPYCMTPLVWNSMLSVGNGWFFVTVNEAFVLGTQDFRLPGVGSYIAVALEKGDTRAWLSGLIAMIVMIVALDQLLWRPLVVWADRFRVDEQPPLDPSSSPVLRMIARSRLLTELGNWGYARLRSFSSTSSRPDSGPQEFGLRQGFENWSGRIQGFLGVAFVSLLLLGAWRMFAYFEQVDLMRWGKVILAAGLTLGRILVATLVCAAWAIPLGVKIGLNARLAKYMQPIIQVTNSFPAPLLFPALLAFFIAVGVNFEVSAVILMMVATFAYLLFNVIGGTTQISQEQRDAWACYGPKNFKYFKKFIFPSILPSLVVGFNTMIGAAWNATIVTEYIRLNGQTYVVGHGLGATINLATEAGDLAMLTVSVFVMSALVVTLNRLFWLPLSDYAARLTA
jgi:NitT/TauT family transport system permease protein